MILIDISNLAHTAMCARREMMYEETSFKALPFILSKVAALSIHSGKFIFVFDPKSSGKRLDYFRTYNPSVVFEVNVIFDLMEYLGFNVARRPGVSADDLIMNLAEIYQELPGKKYIITEDADLVAAVNLNQQGGTMEILGPTINGDNITPFNMYDLTGVPYNFMNVYKTLRGCKSDRIKPLPNGTELWFTFIKHIASMKFCIRGNVEVIHEYLDITKFNNKAYILEWLHSKGVDGSENAEKVFPVKTDVQEFLYVDVDWVRYNAVFNEMFGKVYINQRFDVGVCTAEDLEFVSQTIKKHSIQAVSVFSPSDVGVINTLSGLEDLTFGGV